MKIIAIILSIMLGVATSHAQRIVEESHPVSSDTKIHLDFDFADRILVKSWDKQEVYVKATVNINDGEYNENFNFKVHKAESFLTIESKIDDMKSMHCQTIIIEDGDTTYINGRGTQMDLDFEVYLPENSDLKIETINGDIELSGLDGPLNLSTINGDIDLSVNEGIKADLEMETINGTMYTNLDLQIESKKGNLCKIGGDVNTQLNGGGRTIQLSTINGAMYLRKN